jgi:hypothetical protein
MTLKKYLTEKSQKIMCEIDRTHEKSIYKPWIIKQ